MENRFDNLNGKTYDVIYMDPPWHYGGRKQHGGKGNTAGAQGSGDAETHYPTVPTKELMEWDIGSIAKKDSLIFMWTSSPHMEQAIALGKAWGFEYKTIAFTWYKEVPNPGAYTMSSTEMVLVFKRKGGKIPAERGARNVRQFLSEKRREHSRKPDTIRDRIVDMFPQHDKLEMFSRTQTDGWDAWGNQVDKF